MYFAENTIDINISIITIGRCVSLVTYSSLPGDLVMPFVDFPIPDDSEFRDYIRRVHYFDGKPSYTEWIPKVRTRKNHWPKTPKL